MVFPLELDKINKLAIISGKILEFRVDAWSLFDGDVLIRGFTQNEQINIRLTTTDDRLNIAQTIRITSMPIVLQVENDIAAAQRGDVYVKIRIFLGGVAVYTLLEGYVSEGVDLTWPPGIHQDMFSGRGSIRGITGTNPGAGSEISEVVPTNALWRLIGFHFQLVNDANVATRRVVLIIDDGSDTLMRLESAGVQLASVTNNYSWLSGHGFSSSASIIDQEMPLPTDLYLPQGFRIRTETTNIQAGDNFAAPELFIEEWKQE